MSASASRLVGSHPGAGNSRNKSLPDAHPPAYTASRNSPQKPLGDSQAFRPKLLGLPKDPFATRPWIIDLDALPLSVHANPHEAATRIQQTILVLGTPPQSDLRALVYSTFLQDSLLLIATHDVKPFASLRPPDSTRTTRGPTTRILRLGSPLFPTPDTLLYPRDSHQHSLSTTSLQISSGAGGGSDALRLMSLLNRASQVASLVEPASPGGQNGSTRIQQLGEHPSTGDFSVIEALGSATSTGQDIASRPSTMSSPTPGAEAVASKKAKRRTLNNFFSFGSSSQASSSPTPNMSNAAIQRAGLSPTAAIFQIGVPALVGSAAGNTSRAPGGGRAFDALINYISSPSSIPEKVLLKQVILVTTLSTPYLSASATSPLQGGKFTRVTSRSSDPEKDVQKLHFRDKTLPVLPSLAMGGWETIDTPKRYQGPAHAIHVVPDSASLFGGSAPSTPGATSSSRPKEKARGSIASVSKPKFVTSIEQFLLAYAYPSGLSIGGSSSTIHGKGKGMATSRSTSALLTTRQQHTPPSSSHSQASKSGMQVPNSGKPIPYIIKAGVMGGVFSFSHGSNVQAVSVADLVLFGGLDGSIVEHGGGKAWLGVVGAKGVVDGLLGKVAPGMEVRNGGNRWEMDNVWVGTETEGPYTRPSVKRERSRDRHDLLPVPPPKESIMSSHESPSLPRSRDDEDRSHNRPSRVSRKPAPTIPQSESLMTAWEALAPINKGKSTPSPSGYDKDEEKQFGHGARDGERDRRQDTDRVRHRDPSRTRERSHSRTRRASDAHRNREERYMERDDHHYVRERERERDSRRDTSLNRYREKDRHREGSRDRARYPREYDTGLLTPPGSGSEGEVEFENGLDSPVDPIKGMGAAILGRSPSTPKRPHSEKEHRRHETSPQKATRPDYLRGHSGGSTRSRGPSAETPSGRPTPSRGYSVNGADNIPPSGSTDSAQKAGNESFDFAQYYDYDRTRWGHNQDEELTEERKERGGEAHKHRDKRSRKDDRERRREKEWDRTRDREQVHGRAIDYNRGEMGPAPSRSADDQRERKRSTRHRHDGARDGDQEYRKRTRSSHRRTEELRDVYYYRYEGDTWDDPNSKLMEVRSTDAEDYTRQLHRSEGGKYSLAGVPPNLGHIQDHGHRHDNEDMEKERNRIKEKRSSKSISRKYHYV